MAQNRGFEPIGQLVDELTSGHRGVWLVSTNESTDTWDLAFGAAYSSTLDEREQVDLRDVTHLELPGWGTRRGFVAPTAVNGCPGWSPRLKGVGSHGRTPSGSSPLAMRHVSGRYSFHPR